MWAIWIKLKVKKNQCRCDENVGVKLFEIVYRMKLVNKVWKNWLCKVMIEMWWMISKFWEGYD